MRTRSTTLAALLLSLVLSASAGKSSAALVEVSAAVSNFTYQLIDLTPDDGLTPWIRFDWMASPKASLFYDPDWSREFAQNPNRDYEPVLLERGPDIVRGQVTPELVTLDLRIAEGSAQAYMEHIASYSISPNTRFVFSADAALDSSVAPGPRANAWAGMSGMFMLAPDGIPLSFEGGALTTPGGPVSGTVSVGAASGALEGSGVLFLGASAIASSLSPIPEPGQAGLLAAGLVLLWARTGARLYRRAQPGRQAATLRRPCTRSAPGAIRSRSTWQDLSITGQTASPAAGVHSRSPIPNSSSLRGRRSSATATGR